MNIIDFLAALKRMILIKNDHSNPKLVRIGNYNNLDDCKIFISKNENLNRFSDFFFLKIDEKGPLEGIDKLEKCEISDNVIVSLGECLKDEHPSVRETAVSTLGKIGLPEAILCVDKIIHLMNDKDVNVKSKAIWALGKLAKDCEVKTILPVLENLKSNIWKVKMACFVTITSFGERCSKIVLPTLKKMLKETNINKQIISETIIKLGIDGETCLIDMMRTEIDSNYNLKSSIAKSLALTNISSPNIDFVVESLYKHASYNFY